MEDMTELQAKLHREQFRRPHPVIVTEQRAALSSSFIKPFFGSTLNSAHA